MKIIMLAPAYYPSGGGVEKHIRMVASELKKQGHHIIILVRYGKYLPKYQKVDDIPVWRLPKLVRYPLLTAWVAAHRFIFKEVDAFHSHDFYPAGLRRLFPHINWVHTFHGYEGFPVTEKAIYFRRKVREEVRHCICVGHFIEKWYGTKCDYVTYGGSVATNNTVTKPRYDAVFVGRLADDTGFRDYLEGLALTNGKSLLVVGDGPLRGWGEEWSKQRGLKVTFAGLQKVVEGFMGRGKIALVSGYLTLLEAALAKRPIIAHYGTPIKEDYLKMHPMAKNFAIVSSPQEIARAIENPPRQKQVETFYAWARQQTWPVLAQHYLKAYRGQV